LELALALGEGDRGVRGDGAPDRPRRGRPSGVTDCVGDEQDRKALERHGWRLRRAAREIAEAHFDSKRVLAGILDAAL
jgi:hypothetical protein